ncbi:CHAT domain-containing protein [Cystobacter fuscus]|uniref:CHAT domain-containing protein n=1 Tax=Cystobacter fuscus TaxID=43 RepID=UPI002B31939B|nr:CHAT domain-containing protein [Cystobacter fuscus]
MACERIAAFVDGELSTREAEEFQAHLAGCADCQAALEDQLQASLAVRSAAASRRAPRREPFRPSWAHRTTRMWSAGVGMAALVLLGLLAAWWMRPASPDMGAQLLALAPTRSLEGRLGYPGLDGYRSSGTLRDGASGSAELDVRLLARLEEQGDFHGLATAYLLAGEFERAEKALERLPPSPDVDSDRALAALGRGEPERALVALDRALRAAPEHPRAHWNRGVALRAMSLELAAAMEFQLVADRREPGWSEEAKRLAEGLRASAASRSRAWTDMNAAGMALALEGTALPSAMVRRDPDLARLYLYHAIRAAVSREQVLALAPLASALDTAARNSTASDYVQRVARADFARRAPLARTYRALLEDARALTGEQAEAYLTRLRRAGERELLLGAILLLRVERQHLEELRALVEESGEAVWYRAPLVKAQVAEDLAHGDGARAEQRLVAAIDECHRARLEYRCVSLQAELSGLYNQLDRRQEAMGPARAALDVARRLGDWHHEEVLVLALITSARLSHEPALARAYLDEYLQRRPEDCERRADYHHQRALLAIEALDVAEARREVARARECAAPPSLFELAVYGDLLRFGTTADERAYVARRLELLREDASFTPGARLLLEQMAARILIETDRREGQRRLREVIAAAGPLRATDIEARKAWSYAHQTLVMDAGKAGEFDEALTVLAAGQERAAPASCLLAVAGQDERVLFVARGTRGDVRGEYLGQRTRPLLEDFPAVPPAVLEGLAGCDAVRVLAEPVLLGRPGLLGPERAWSYLVPGGGEGKGPETGLPPKHVVVSDVEPPATLGLPRLLPWNRAPRPGEVLLRGASATPDAVLAELEDATEVEFHAHGLIRSGFSDASFLALSPEPDGRYALTVSDLQGMSLRGAPLVLLAACRANGGALRYYAVASLPAAFIQAGARSVVAPASPIPDAQGGAFFQALLDEVGRGATPAEALARTRSAWLRDRPAPWVSELVLFE